MDTFELQGNIGRLYERPKGNDQMGIFFVKETQMIKQGLNQHKIHSKQQTIVDNQVSLESLVNLLDIIVDKNLVQKQQMQDRDLTRVLNGSQRIQELKSRISILNQQAARNLEFLNLIKKQKELQSLEQELIMNNQGSSLKEIQELSNSSQLNQSRIQEILKDLDNLRLENNSLNKFED